ncbi:MAG: ribosome maturation factor RimP [Acidimicrobiales bacterium]
MTDDLYDALLPVVAAHDLELVDVEAGAGLLRVTVDREGGVDLDGLASANRALSAALDELDAMPGRYTLEVTSPGVERRLRTPAQFARAVGETVSVRLAAGSEGDRRLEGRLASADGEGLDLELARGPVRVRYDAIDRARTVFTWGPAPKPGTRRVTTP